jgi:hypothetical protein
LVDIAERIESHDVPEHPEKPALDPRKFYKKKF